MMQTPNQLTLPGTTPTPFQKKTRRHGPIVVTYPPNAEIATIAGKWRRLPTGEIEATYTREEFELCQRVIGE